MTRGRPAAEASAALASLASPADSQHDRAVAPDERARDNRHMRSRGRKRIAALAITLTLAALGCRPEHRPSTATPAHDARDAAPNATAPAGADPVPTTTILQEADRLAVGRDGVWAWRPTRGPAARVDATGAARLIAGSDGGRALAFSADGHALLAGPARLEVRDDHIDVPAAPARFGEGLVGKLQTGLAPTAYEPVGAAWSADGELVVVALRHRPGRGPAATLPPDMPKQRLVAFDRSGTYRGELGREALPLIAVGRERVFATGGLTISVWQRGTTFTQAPRITAQAGISALALAPDETRLAYAWNPGTRGTADSAGHVALVAADGAPGPTWRADRYVADLAWHPTGAMLATAGDDGAHLWRLTADGAAEVALPVPAGGPATAVAFAPDGRTLAVARGGAAPQVDWVPLPAP